MERRIFYELYRTLRASSFVLQRILDCCRSFAFRLDLLEDRRGSTRQSRGSKRVCSDQFLHRIAVEHSARQFRSKRSRQHRGSLRDLFRES